MRSSPKTSVHLPKMSRYTQPDKAQQLLLAQLQMTLPPQPPPEITSDRFKTACGEDL